MMYVGSDVLVCFRNRSLCSFLVELGDTIKMASMMVPSFMAIPFALRWAFTASKICSFRSSFSKRCRNARIVVQIRCGSMIRSRLANRRMVNSLISESWIANVVALLNQMIPQHGSQRIRRAPTLGAGYRVVGLNQVDQRLPWHNGLQLGKKSLALGALFGRGHLVFTKTKLLPAHQFTSQL